MGGRNKSVHFISLDKWRSEIGTSVQSFAKDGLLIFFTKSYSLVSENSDKLILNN